MRKGRATVYFIQAVNKKGPVKIGLTRGPVEKRLEDLQAACPYKLRIAACIFDAYPEVESHLHLRFHWSRIHGEWFKGNTPGLQELIADVNAGNLPDQVRGIIDAQRGFEDHEWAA